MIPQDASCPMDPEDARIWEKMGADAARGWTPKTSVSLNEVSERVQDRLGKYLTDLLMMDEQHRAEAYLHAMTGCVQSLRYEGVQIRIS